MQPFEPRSFRRSRNIRPMAIAGGQATGPGSAMPSRVSTSLDPVHPSSRMLKKSASGVLASLPGNVKRGSAARRCGLLGTRRVLARWGWEGVRRLAFLSILRGVLLLSRTCGRLNFHRATIVFQHPAISYPTGAFTIETTHAVQCLRISP